MAKIFKHPQASVESDKIGRGSSIWAFVHILPNARIGMECNIADHVFIENDVIIGNRVTIKCGVQLWDGLRIEDDVFIGPNATFTNDLFPRSKQYPKEFLKTFIQKGASIGANATILPGITIGQKAMVGAGAVVTRSVPPHAVVVGNPGKIIGYVDTKRQSVEPDSTKMGTIGSNVGGVFLRQIKHVNDLRGDLAVTELEQDLPFKVKRMFFVYNVPNERVRGEHAHKECHQFLTCVKGQISVVVDDGKEREEFTLDRPYFGLYVPPMVWAVQYKYSPDAVLLVFASDIYDPDDYIRDYDQFIDLVNQT